MSWLPSWTALTWLWVVYTFCMAALAASGPAWALVLVGVGAAGSLFCWHHAEKGTP